jgi:hypothetical protein
MECIRKINQKISRYNSLNILDNYDITPFRGYLNTFSSAGGLLCRILLFDF